MAQRVLVEELSDELLQHACARYMKANSFSQGHRVPIADGLAVNPNAML